MAASTFYIPSVNVIGNGALSDAMNTMREYGYRHAGNDSNLLIVFYVQIMPDDFVMQLHRF